MATTVKLDEIAEAKLTILCEIINKTREEAVKDAINFYVNHILDGNVNMDNVESFK